MALRVLAKIKIDFHQYITNQIALAALLALVNTALRQILSNRDNYNWTQYTYADIQTERNQGLIIKFFGGVLMILIWSTRWRN